MPLLYRLVERGMYTAPARRRSVPSRYLSYGRRSTAPLDNPGAVCRRCKGAALLYVQVTRIAAAARLVSRVRAVGMLTACQAGVDRATAPPRKKVLGLHLRVTRVASTWTVALDVRRTDRQDGACDACRKRLCSWRRP